MKRNIILLGKGELGIRIAEWFVKSPDWELNMVVPVMPEPVWAASLVGWCQKNSIPFVQSGHYKDIPGILNKNWQIDLGFSVFYDKIVKEWFIKKCRRMLNLHNSPLPRYRGVSPINWALKNNEKEHGLTIHEITEGIDEGPIVAQLKYSIYPEFDEVQDVYQRSLKYGFLLFEQTMPLFYKIVPQPQDHALATYYDKKQDELLGERKNFTKKISKK